MDKMTMCRICLVENVRMNIVADKDLQELYETLTDIPFVTEDRRPMLACFICFAKLKQCCQLKRKCLEAEERFAQMMNEENLLVSQGQLEVSAGASHIESPAVKVEVPEVYERLHDIIVEIKEERTSDELEPEWLNNSYSDAEDIPEQQSESLLEYHVPLVEMKVEEDLEVSWKKRRASDMTRPAVEEKPKLHVLGKKLEDVVTEIQKKYEDSDTKFTRSTQNCTSKVIPTFQEPLPNTTLPLNISIIDTTLGKNCDNNSKKRNVAKNSRGSASGELYKCNICHHNFLDKARLIKHVRIHTGEKPYKCDFCQSCFSEKGHLTRHIRTHSGEKPYKCEECQLCFIQKSNLTRHIRTHTGEKPYKCKECPLSFRQKDHLTSHIRTHTGEKLFKCEECNLSFSKKSNLTRHSRTHTGEKLYKCKECELCFTRRGHLLGHFRLHTDKKL